ncbi:hypothetical protein [Staphylococcus pettenkoferi]|uniref:hypothetical protein n=1 Tax=Staphylococcus pettenkoferi TaxID=170573 RepID=UPI0022724CFA|nr:hypothetical protein [Staphylococcus pettenkoferi]MCY1602447.1 hypothetical protein [Staphylococcus pettenkoferi]
MLQLMDGFTLSFNTPSGIKDVSEIVTASDIKKYAREDSCSFTEEVAKYTLIGYDDNGNGFYV